MVTYCLVVAVVACAYIQLIFGYICRWCSWSLPQAAAQFAYYVSNVVNTIALGRMSSENHSGVWIMYLVALNHSLEGNDQGNNFQFVLSSINIGIIVWRALVVVSHTDLPQGLPSAVPVIFIFALVFVCSLWKLLAYLEIIYKCASHDVAKYITDRSRYEGETGNINSYRYKVTSTTTVSNIYNRQYGERQQGRDICLSFALFRLLFRRHQEVLCDEDKVVPETGLISAAHVELGFKVIEVELAFLHSYIHGGYVLWSGRHYIIAYIALVLKTVLKYVGIFLLSHDRQSVALIVSQVVFDLLQIISYCNSNTWMVYHMCRCLPDNTSHLGRLDKFIARLNMKKIFARNFYWQNRIGQLSLLEDETPTSQNLFPPMSLQGLFSDQPMFILPARESKPAPLTRHLKARIAEFLNEADALDGVPSLEYMRREREVSIINIILKWHIATRYCQIACPEVESTDKLRHDVADTLSRYCAYLVAFRPKLIPDKVTEPMDKLEEVLKKVRDLKRPVTLEVLDDRRLSLPPPTDELAPPGDVEEGKKTSTMPRDGYAILTDGLKLGWKLLNSKSIWSHSGKSIQSDSDCWKILENIWIKLVLSIAIQGETGHMECLAQGGEFMTHLWAMISHARIIQKKTWSAHVYDLDKAEDFIKELLENYH